MNRLSTYAAREAQESTPEQKQKDEEEATLKLLERIQISKGNSPSENGENRDTTDTDAESMATTAVDPEETLAASASGSEKGARGIPDDIKLFEIFNEQVQSLVKIQRLPLWDSVALMVALTNLALNIYPDRLDYVDQVLGFAKDKVAQYVNSADLHSQASQSQIVALLLAPVKSYFSIFTALALPNFIPLLHAQPYPSRRAIAGEIARTILQNQIKIDSEDGLKAVLEVLRVIIKEGTQQTSGYPGGPLQRKGQETDETIEEQGWIARMVHLLQSSSNDTQFKVSRSVNLSFRSETNNHQLLQTAQKAFSEGSERIKYTYPPVITAALKLARRYKTREHLDDNWSTQSSLLYKFIHSMLSSLYARVNGFNDMALRLFVACGQIADQTGHEEVAYEFFAQAFTVYEEAISDSRAQFQAVCVIAGALHQSRGFGKENYDTLITKCALHGSKLLKKPDQCRAVYLASHLWWATQVTALGEEETKDVGFFPRWIDGLLTGFSSTAMENVFLSVCSEHFALQMLAWILLCLLSFLLRF